MILQIIRLRVFQLRRTAKLFWLLCDQGIFALTNFGLNLLFARWLAPAEYGLYGVSFAGFILISIIHYTAVIEPLLVQAAGVDKNRHHGFVRTVIVAHCLLNLIMAAVSVALYMIAERLGARNIGLAIVCAGVGGPAVLALLTARRLCLVFMSAQVSAIIGVIYSIGSAATVYWLHANEKVSWLSLWSVMGLWSLIGTAIILVKLVWATRGTNSEGTGGRDTYSLAELCRFQWRYAKYGIFGALFAWLRGSGTMMIASHFVALGALGGVVAVQSLGQALVSVNSALAASWLVRFGRGSTSHIDTIALRYAGVVGGVVVLSGWFAPSLIHALYHGKYDQYAWQLPIVLLTVGVLGLEDLFTSRLKAAGRLWEGYAPHIGGAVGAIVASFTLTPWIGASGVVLSVTVGATIGLAFAIWPRLSVPGQIAIRFPAEPRHKWRNWVMFRAD